MLGREVHNEDVDWDEDTSTTNSTAGSYHQADGGVKKSKLVGVIEGKQWFVRMMMRMRMVVVGGLEQQCTMTIIVIISIRIMVNVDVMERK